MHGYGKSLWRNTCATCLLRIQSCGGCLTSKNNELFVLCRVACGILTRACNVNAAEKHLTRGACQFFGHSAVAFTVFAAFRHWVVWRRRVPRPLSMQDQRPIVVCTALHPSALHVTTRICTTPSGERESTEGADGAQRQPQEGGCPIVFVIVPSTLEKDTNRTNPNRPFETPSTHRKSKMTHHLTCASFCNIRLFIFPL